MPLFVVEACACKPNESVTTPDRGNSGKSGGVRCQTVPMAPSDGWHLIGPLIAVALIGLLGAVFWRIGLHRTTARDDLARDDDPLRDLYGLAIFTEPDDYGLLSPAAVTDEPEVAAEIRMLLADAGIRATQAVRPDGRVVVLVFAEQVEEARRLVGGSPAL